MKIITYEEMYDPPAITIEQTIYQLIVNVYTKNASNEWNATPHIFNNPTITGKSGTSFTIDNPLVIDANMADLISDWYFAESNYNAVYVTNWRQNPALECTDIILIQDPYESNKQTRIYRQEFTFEGYLEGTTESRGGI
jgi:hypothetical protein